MQDIKVFISYSWTNDELVNWVREDLATRLSDDGIEVILDQWDLKEGQDVYAFMESMVNNPDINKVLVVCDKGYKSKADSRQGGVGTETQIITPEIYKDAKQEKFIPVIFEKDEQGNDFIPTFMSGRKYIDLSGNSFFENYEQLLRTIYERPLHRKPKRGNPPAYLFKDEQINNYKFSFILKQLQHSVNIGKTEIAKANAIEFKNEFIDSLKEFKVEKLDKSSDQVAQEIEDRIDDMLILKNEYVNLIELLSANNLLDVDFLIEFFENFHNEKIGIQSAVNESYFEHQFDQYSFLINELFIYTALILIKNSNFELLAEFLYSRFFVYQDFVVNGKNGAGFEIFNRYVRALNDIQVRKGNTNYISYSSKKIMLRRSSEKYTNTDLANTDILLYYISCLKQNKGENNSEWFPYTYIYSKEKIEILQKMESRRHFEKVKCLFEVESEEDFITLVGGFENPRSRGYHQSFDSIPDIVDHIDLDSIFKYR